METRAGARAAPRHSTLQATIFGDTKTFSNFLAIPDATGAIGGR